MWNILNNVLAFLPKKLEWQEFYLRAVYLYLSIQREIRRQCRGLEAWQIVTNTATIMFFVWLIVEILRRVFRWCFINDEGVFERSKKTLFRILRQLPFLKEKIKRELELKKYEMQKELFSTRKHEIYITKLPKNGFKQQDVLLQVEKYVKMGSIPWSRGSGVVYHGGQDLTELQTTVFKQFLWSNALHSDVFPSVTKMEAEVVRMCCNLFHGSKSSCGTMTCSGTESILMACKTYRDWAKTEKAINKPEIIVAESAHAAFDKAAQYFKIKLIKIPVNKQERSVNIKAMRKAITSQTILLVGSAPEFPHGIVDDIKSIAQLGLRYNIGVHVDACLGGFVLAFMKEAGYDAPLFDFSLKGVTSLSVDTHKYGCSPKGSSLVLYHNEQLRHYQYHACPDWSGGIYVTPTIAGSRSGATIAQCWTSMMHLGKSGYINATKRIVRTTRTIRNGLRKIQGIFVYGDPQVCVVAFGSEIFDIFALGDELSARNWKLNALQFPSSLHICITLPMAKPEIAERFLKDVKECSAKIMRNPDWKTTGPGAIYGMAQRIPDRSLVKELASHYLDCLYSVTSSEASNGEVTKVTNNKESR